VENNSGMRNVKWWEKPLALVRRPPRHERLPERRKPARRASKLALHAILAPVSLAGRAILLLAGRSGRLSPDGIRRIAFIKVDHLGDVLMATPLMRALKDWAPAARLTVFARPAVRGLLSRLSYVDAVENCEVPWILPGSGSWGNLRACLGLARRLRAGRFNLVVDLRYHNRLDSLLLSLCGARARLGYDAGGFGFWITHRAPLSRAGHEIERGAAALRRFGVPVHNLGMDLPLFPSEEREALALAGGKRPFVAIHPGAGNPVKRWMPERFAWVGRELARRARVRIAVLAGPGEEELGGPLVRALPRAARVDLRGRLSVFEMAAVIRRAALFIGNDGGPAHVAAAVKARSLVVFSGTSVAKDWAPPGASVIEKWVPCKPCYSSTCPYGQACLRKAGVDEVLAGALRLLGVSRRKSH